MIFKVFHAALRQKSLPSGGTRTASDAQMGAAQGFIPERCRRRKSNPGDCFVGQPVAIGTSSNMHALPRPAHSPADFSNPPCAGG
jgi:hypothetical protein